MCRCRQGQSKSGANRVPVLLRAMFATIEIELSIRANSIPVLLRAGCYAGIYSISSVQESLCRFSRSSPIRRPT